jgi:hypothetical protein
MTERNNKGPVEDALEQQIVKAQNRVIRTKTAHDTAVDALQKLLDKRDARRKDELWGAIVKSQRSYEDIMKYITAEADEDAE